MTEANGHFRVADHAVGHQFRAHDADLELVLQNQNDTLWRRFRAGACGRRHHQRGQATAHNRRLVEQVA